MKRTLAHFAGLIALLAAGRMAAASATNPGPAKKDYQAFDIIQRQNIFDPNRNPAPTPEPVPPRIDTFTLTGTLTSAEGQHAFFEGGVLPHRKAAFAPAGRIEGFTITRIAGDGVTLESAGGQAIHLAVGARMTRVDEGPWKVNSATQSGQ